MNLDPIQYGFEEVDGLIRPLLNESSSGSAGRLVLSVEIEIKHLNIPELDEDENSEIEQDEHDMAQTNIDCILEESQNEECSGDDDQSDDMTT